MAIPYGDLTFTRKNNMLCGHCRKQILCIRCDETEYSQTAGTHRFEPEKCECERVDRYENKDAMWYIKSAYEAILIFIGCICLIGFVLGMIFVLALIPMVWGKPISYHPFPWLGAVMAWSICVGLVDILFMASWNYDYGERWRDDYKVHIEEYEREKKPLGYRKHRGRR